MKLLFCLQCHDIKKIHKEMTFCKCKKSKGRYLEDGLHAEFGGEAIPLGIDNKSLVKALNHSLTDEINSDRGIRFEAFTIPDKCSTIKFI